MEQLHELATQHFYSGYADNDTSRPLMPTLARELRALVGVASARPELLLALAMVKYHYFFFSYSDDSAKVDEGSLEEACVLLEESIKYGGCDLASGLSHDLGRFVERQCPSRWAYLLMLLLELGREFAISFEVERGATWLQRGAEVWDSMKALPYWAQRPWLQSPYDFHWNDDVFPGVHPSGPVWKASDEDTAFLPLASFLEESFQVIRAELDAVLAQEGLFDSLHFESLNAEGQDHKPEQAWRQVELADTREGERWKARACGHFPGTCELLRSRRELEACDHASAMLVRMSAGAWLKPHYGGPPRLVAHLGLRDGPGAVLYVGNHTLRWQEGRAHVFDDTYVHSARHLGRAGAADRYILHVLFCHPCEAGQRGLYDERVQCQAASLEPSSGAPAGEMMERAEEARAPRPGRCGEADAPARQFSLGGGGHGLAACKAACLQQDDCHFMTYYEQTGFCHMYQTCQHVRSAHDGGRIHLRESLVAAQGK